MRIVSRPRGARTVQEIVIGDLMLRPWRVEDAAVLNIAITQCLDHLRPWMPWIAAEPLPVDERRALITKWQTEREAGGDIVFGMFVGDDIVGGCGLHRRIGPNALEIGYWVHVNHVRKGYATTASAALTSLAFTFPEVDAVEIHHDQANTASEGVPRKLGYAYVGEQARDVQAPSETGIQRVWRMRRADWPSVRESVSG